MSATDNLADEETEHAASNVSDNIQLCFKPKTRPVSYENIGLTATSI